MAVFIISSPISFHSEGGQDGKIQKAHPFSTIFCPVLRGKVWTIYVGPISYYGLFNLSFPIFLHNQIREIYPFLSYFFLNISDFNITVEKASGSYLLRFWAWFMTQKCPKEPIPFINYAVRDILISTHQLPDGDILMY